MKIVSYTRATSCDPLAKEIRNPITKQTEHIRAYMKARRWRLSRRYSDSSRDPKESNGFKEMKNDSLNREFDCLVVDSIFYLGVDVYQSLHFLKKSFYPAGLHFVVVEDDFYSAEHTPEEVYEYITRKRSELNGKYTKYRMLESSVESYFSVYGFSYDKEKHIVEIDEKSAEIIREVYTRLKDGEQPQSIAQDLTERGVENPSDYFCRQRGWPPRSDFRGWNTKSIRTVSMNPKYIGKWDCSYDPEQLDIRCGAIVDPDLFNEVQKVIHGRYYQVPIKRKPSPYSKMIWDKESGMPLHYFNNSRTGHSDIRFKYPKEKDIKYDKAYIPYDEFHRQVRDLLLQEKQNAEKVIQIIESQEGNERKQEAMKEVRDQFPLLLDEMAALEEKKLSAYKQLQENKLQRDSYNKTVKIIELHLQRIEREIQKLIDDLTSIETIYSVRNPWINAFIKYDENKKLTRKKAMKYVKKIMVYRFESIEMIPMELEWKMALPREWTEVRNYGKNQ